MYMIIWSCKALPDIAIIKNCSDEDITPLEKYKDSEITCTCEGKRDNTGQFCMACTTGLCGYEFKPSDAKEEINEEWGGENYYTIYHHSRMMTFVEFCHLTETCFND